MNKITSTSNGVYPGQKLKGKDKYQKLYHFTSFDTFVRIWLTQQLKYGHVLNVNDMLEIDRSASAPRLDQIAIIYAYNDIRASYKQISFTMDYDSYVKGCMSPIMWGQYADKRKGVCIELDFDKLNIPTYCYAKPVKYKTLLDKSTILDSDITTIKQIRHYIKRHKDDIFFTKQRCWSAENEYRIVNDRDDFLDIEGAVSAIYLTSYDSLECRLVEKLVNGTVPVEYIHHIAVCANKALPVSSSTQIMREQMDRSTNNPNNLLATWTKQAQEFYERNKHDENASLILKLR